MTIGLTNYKTYLDERVKCYPFIKEMIDLYKGLIDIWDNALPDDLSPLLSPERASKGSYMLDEKKIGDVDFTNSVNTARKLLRLVEGEELEGPIGISDRSTKNIGDFIKDRLSREDRYKNAILKWMLKPSFTYLIKTSNSKSGVRGFKGRCPLCSSPPGMAIVDSDPEGGDQRFLSCCFCGYKWPFELTACPACGNSRPEKFGFFVGESGCEQGTRAISCEGCKTYIKTAFIRCREDGKGASDLDLDIEDVATLPLDIIANQRGYVALCQR